MKRIIFDFETRSKCDLKKSGAFKYSLDDSTRPTCLAFKDRDQKIVYFLNFQAINRQWRDQSEKLKNLWRSYILNGYEFTGHNAFFETVIYKNILVKRYGWPDIPFKQFRCTAAKAAACALPRNLDGAGGAMKLRIQKDKWGYIAMLRTCRPTKKWADWNRLQQKIKSGAKINEKSRLKSLEPEPRVFLEPEDDPRTWQTLYDYCKIDVKAEELLDRSLPDLPPQEQEIWFLNQKLNWRGLRIDIPTVKKIVGIMDIESKKKLKELDSLTMGLVTKPGARQSILDFLALDGIELPNIQSKTVSDSLEGFNLTEDTRRLLEIRKALSMTSTKKYQSFLNRANEDEHVRDILLYHGASTGRDTGTGIQPHNIPRGLIKVDKDRPYAAVDNVVECDHEMLQLLYGESLGILFSSILRNMILPSKEHELFVADFSKIEVAVLWWLSDNEPGLKILRDGLDPYKYQASANTKKPYIAIADDSDDRQLGKAQVLGCGFGMGWKKFQETAWRMYRLRLTEKQSKDAVSNYRTANEAVPILWKDYEEAAVNAVDKIGTEVLAGKCKFIVRDNFLWVTLPSGINLAYREPQLNMRDSEYGERKTLEFMAVNSKTKKWDLERTWGGTLTENIVQAVARDLMMPAMVRLEKKGYRSLLMVHDEGICEKRIGEGSIEEFVKILCECPHWAQGATT